jgi:hypothetical protein
MKHLTFLTSAAALALPLLLASGAGNAAPEGGAPGAAAAAPAAPAGKLVGPPEVAWKDMTPQQRGRYMKEVVTPKMKVTFQEYDADLFKKFDCGTCHGKDAKARKFKMPGPDIHALPATPDAFKAAMAKKPSWPKWTKFMGEKVEPQMANILGVPMFDWKKPEAGGFGCKNCHMLEGAETKDALKDAAAKEAPKPAK